MSYPWNSSLWHRLIEQRERRAHAHLFCGVAGLGKRELALEFGRHLLATDKRTQQLFDAGSHPDMHIVMPEALVVSDEGQGPEYARRYVGLGKKSAKPARIITVDQIRQLIGTVYRHPHMAQVKYVVIMPADRMNLNAANALLKALEEPPADTVFVLVSAHPERLPATIRSRCVSVEFRPPPTNSGVAWVADRLDGDTDRARLLLHLAAGAPLQALALAAGDFEDRRAKLIGELKTLIAGRSDASAVAQAWVERDAISEGLQFVQRLLGDLVHCRMLTNPAMLSHGDQRDWLQETAKRIHLKECYALWDRLGATIADLEGPLDKTLIAEDTLLELGQILQYANQRG